VRSEVVFGCDGIDLRPKRRQGQEESEARRRIQSGNRRGRKTGRTARRSRTTQLWGGGSIQGAPWVNRVVTLLLRFLSGSIRVEPQVVSRSGATSRTGRSDPAGLVGLGTVPQCRYLQGFPQKEQAFGESWASGPPDQSKSGGTPGLLASIRSEEITPPRHTSMVVRVCARRCVCSRALV
jgi:hypothetical protein